MKKLIVGFALVVLGTGIASARDIREGQHRWISNDERANVVTTAPEMDATSAIGAMTLLLGGLAVLAGRKVSK